MNLTRGPHAASYALFTVKEDGEGASTPPFVEKQTKQVGNIWDGRGAIFHGEIMCRSLQTERHVADRRWPQCTLIHSLTSGKMQPLYISMRALFPPSFFMLCVLENHLCAAATWLYREHHKARYYDNQPSPAVLPLAGALVHRFKMQ